MSAETHYRRLLDLSQRMLVAGMAQQWDELVLLEQQRSAMLESFSGVAQSELMQPTVELIHQIQASDAELREKLDAWMAHARILLRLDKPVIT